MSSGRLVAVAGGIIAAAVSAGGIAAQQPTATAQTVQQQFDAATKLSQGTDAAATLAAWEALEGRVARNRRTHAIVLIRKSQALLQLRREDDALVAARAGLADLPESDRTLDADRFDALTTVAFANKDSLDYAGAAEAFSRAATFAATPADKLNANLGLVQVATFTDPALATTAMGRVDAVVAANGAAPVVQAAVEQARALLLLNQGQFAAAVVPAKLAVTRLGGLTQRTDLRDVAARSTASLALLLAGSGDSAREYMAMTGAGRLPSGQFDPAVQMSVPDCGGDAGLKPSDVAVVQFSIDDDGAVRHVAPIYATNGHQVALHFAQAARGWSWTPDQVKGLPTFFRYMARVEMRCSTGFERPGVSSLLAADLVRWLGDHGVEVPSDAGDGDARQVATQRAALARAVAADPAGLQTLAALWALSVNAVVGREETHDLLLRAMDIARAKKAPALVLLALDVDARRTAKASFRRGEMPYRPLLTDPVYTADPEARAAARLVMAESMGRKDDAQRPLLAQVAEDAALAKDNRFRVGALVRLASLEQEGGNTELARTTFEKTGLDPSQCSLIDAPPKLVKVGGTYPQEAVRWGFEGWTQTQFDITADGRVVNERAILSYPPFVFSKAGTQTMADARYAKTFRPGGELGCGASTSRVRFLMPH
ncbi:hypothetical protein SAMN05192583_0223 [Sphingomonas gellani]|uniref:TonB C-terminal domain-containing protein n=1 Tax=Sphingomonas gellani TaxID=1166340 RepID=A0A1H7YFL7_9SPHN|nr:hypothetical protein [Sphingomonas gellani]SEM44128.1 hypothetical protein SAMN05192583_0223 [Sphingomonas gellani]